MEVKSTVASQPQEVVSTGSASWTRPGPRRFTCSISRSTSTATAGETLTDDGRASVRALAAGTPVEGALDDRLLDYGYHDVHEPKLPPCRVHATGVRLLPVGPGFPRIIESDLPTALAGCSYMLASPRARVSGDRDRRMERMRHGSGR